MKKKKRNTEFEDARVEEDYPIGLPTPTNDPYAFESVDGGSIDLVPGRSPIGKGFGLRKRGVDKLGEAEYHKYHITHQGRKAGSIVLRQTNPAQAHVMWMEVNKEHQGHSLRGVFKKLHQKHPEVKRVTGERITGKHTGFNEYNVGKSFNVKHVESYGPIGSDTVGGQPDPSSPYKDTHMMHHYSINHPEHGEVGHVRLVTYPDKPGHAHLAHIGVKPEHQGASLSGVFRQLKTFHPDIKHLTGTRITGAHQGSNVYGQQARTKTGFVQRLRSKLGFGKSFWLAKGLFHHMAIRYNGRVYHAKPGHTHAGAMEDAENKGETFSHPTAQIESGMVNRRGKFYTRPEVTKIGNRYEKLRGSNRRYEELHSVNAIAQEHMPKLNREQLRNVKERGILTSEEAKHYPTHKSLSPRALADIANYARQEQAWSRERLGALKTNNRARVRELEKKRPILERARTMLRQRHAIKSFFLAKANHKLHYRTNFQGMPIGIENRRGSWRHWKDVNGTTGKTKLKDPYGYLNGTKGNDGDAVDVFLGSNPNATHAFVVRQVNPNTGAYDEDKCVLGVDSVEEARGLYLRNYDQHGPLKLGRIDQYPMHEFRSKVLATKNKPGAL